jgi:AAA domain/MarR family
VPPDGPIQLGGAAGVRVDNDDGIADLRKAIQKTKAELVIIGPLARIAPGIDENTSRDVGAIAGNLWRLAHELQVAIVLMHHVRKPANGWSRRPTFTDGRGSNALQGAADGLLLVDRPAQGTRGRLLIQLREGNAGEIEYHFDPNSLLILPRDDAAQAEKSSNEDRALAVIGDQPGISMSDLATTLGVSTKTLTRLRERLEDTGRIGTERDGRKVRLYLIPDRGQLAA